MDDLLSGFWSGWIAVLTAVSLVALAWLVWSIYFSGRGAGHDAAGPVWDETLREGGSAPPMWWFWLILSLTVFSVGYLLFYPGLGNYKGMLEWSQDARMQERRAAYTERFGAIRREIAASSWREIQDNPAWMAAAGRIFSRNCAACHGENGRGQARLFPDLRDADWQWGASPEALTESIVNGRIGNMPAWGAALDAEQIETMADYVLNFRANTLRGSRERHPGHADYTRLCAACHAADGSGNDALGAPHLGDISWTYGNAKESVIHTLTHGRVGVMPAFGGRLDETQIKLLVAYLGRQAAQ